MSVSFEKTGIVRASGGEINKNLLNNTSFDKKSTVTDWDTSKNGNYVATNWNGYNRGVTNQATVYHAHLIQFQGEWVYEYIRTADETWLGVSQGGLQSVIQPNTTYTWSIDEYRPTGSNNYITAGLHYKKTSDGANSFWAGCPHGEGSDDRDRWVRRTFTFTIGEIYTGTHVTMYIYGNSGGNGTIYMRRPKLEIGDKATPWCPCESEGYVESIHGFIETGNMMRVHQNNIETTEFIEW